MNDKIRKSLFDIVLASEEIAEFVQGIDFFGFQQNKLVQKAVEREFEIIGEALSRIEKMDTEILANISEYHKIIGFRNILAHGYDTIDEKLVWDAITKHLPILMNEINKLLNV